jgi:hypothetical protein
MEDLEPYKSLRTIIFEIQEAAAVAAAPKKPAPKASQQSSQQNAPQSAHRPGESWETASGWAAMNKDGVKEYGFSDEKAAKSWATGTGPGTGKSGEGMDTSRPVQLDKNGEKQKPTGAAQPNATPTAAAGTKPAAPQPAGGAAPKAQAAASDTQRTAQPQGSQKGAEQKPAQAQQQPAEDPEVKSVTGEDPQSAFDAQGQGETGKDNAGFKKTGKKAKFKTEEDKAKSVRKSKMLASAIKSGKMTGPQDDSESLTGNAEAERAYVAELNHAALQSGMGGDVIDHEPCSKMFAALGFCYDKEGKQTDKGIKRPEMPQLSGIVDTDRTDSVAYKEALKQAKRKKAAKDKFKTNDPTKDQLKEVSDDEIAAAQPSNEEIGSEEVNFEEKFIEALKNAGYDVEETEVNPSTLKPIQTEMQGSKIAGMYSTIAAAEVDPQTYGKEAERLKAPIFTSGGHVIDGHHRWAAMIGADMANGRGTDMRMKTRNIKKGGKDVDIDEMVAFSNAFQHAMGITNQDRNSKPTRKNFSDAELKTSEEIAKGLGIKENKPQAKPQPQKEWTMSKFGAKRMQNLVESLNEAAKAKFKKPRIASDEPDTFGGAPLEKSKASVGGKMGIKPISIAQQVTRDARSELAVKNNEKTAADLVATMDKKPEGTTFEIYGKKNGKETSVKVKKVRYMGSVVYMVGTNQVELRVAGTGLQIINKKTNRMLLDRGADLIWESADLCDVGMISITEAESKMPKNRKMNDWDLMYVDDYKRKLMDKKLAAQQAERAKGNTPKK